MSAIENDYIIAWSPANSICLTFLNVDTLLQHKMIAFLEIHHNEYTRHRFCNCMVDRIKHHKNTTKIAADVVNLHGMTG